MAAQALEALAKRTPFPARPRREAWVAGLVAGLILGIVVSRYAGGRGFAGFAKALGWSVLVVGGGITLLGGMAWLSAEREPLVSGRPIDLVVEV